MKQLIVAVVAGLFLCGPAQAQGAGDPILTHYRAYRAALEANDQTRAESEAAAALAASEARDGDGGRTAVLALNLALVRMDRGRVEEALAPAQRAFALAQAADAGVDPNAARLTVARISLALGAADAPGEMDAALQAAAAAGGPADYIQPAAFQYGTYLFAQGQYEESQAAWALAGTFATGAGSQRDYIVARGKIGEGAAMMMRARDLDGQRRERRALFEGAYDSLQTARDLLGPIAASDSASGDMTLAQLAYAETLAWRGALRAVARSVRADLDQEDDEEAQGDGLVEMDPGGGGPRCMLGVAHGRIDYPQTALRRGEVGAVVVRMLVNGAGEVTRTDVVSRVGSPAFVEEVADESEGWSVTLKRESEPGCRMAMTVFVPVVFLMS